MIYAVGDGDDETGESWWCALVWFGTAVVVVVLVTCGLV